MRVTATASTMTPGLNEVQFPEELQRVQEVEKGTHTVAPQ